MFDKLFEQAADASRSIPVCPDCGELWMTIDLPPRPRDPGPVTRRVRVACKHQETTFDVRDKYRGDADRYQAFTQRYERLMPPRTFAGIDLDGLPVAEGSAAGKRAATRYVETWTDRKANGDGLLFAGPTGTYKTLTASAIANELETRRQFVVFLTVVELQSRFRDFDNARVFGEACRRADLLVLDDFGQEPVTEWAASELFATIDARYREKRPVIITTNLGKEALEDHYIRCLTLGKSRMPMDQARLTVRRIMSRLRERCAAVQFTGDDQRERASHGWLIDPRKES
jgi:DNA replication protein DnaC